MSEQKFLDKIGLSTFLEKLKTIFAPKIHSHDAGTNSIYEKSTEGTRYVKFADLICKANYFRLNQQVIVSSREESILLNIKCQSTNSNFFNAHSISYTPLTPNCSKITDNIFAGIINLESNNKIELWYKQIQWGASINIIPIGKNKEGPSLTFYNYNSAAVGNANAPTFTTAIPLTSMINWSVLQNKPSTFTPATHSHTKSEVGLNNVNNTADGEKSVKYATSAGTATSATKLGSENKGSATQPIYLNAGTPTACTYTLGKSVPANAVFTDTTYTNMTGASSYYNGTSGLVPAPLKGNQNLYLRGDGNWATPENTTYGLASTNSNGLMSSSDKSKHDIMVNILDAEITQTDIDSIFV